MIKGLFFDRESALTLVLFFIIILFSIKVKAQNKPDTISEQIGLKPEVFKKVLNRQFTNLITGQSKNSIGNYASLDLKETEVSFSGNTIFNGGSVLGIKASGAVTDGLFSIFNNSKLNTQVALEVQYDMLALKKRSLTYYLDSKEARDKKIEQIKSEYKTRELTIFHKQDSTLLQLRHKKLMELIVSLQEKAKTENNNLRKDSLAFEIMKLNNLCDSIGIALQNFPSLGKQEFELDNWKAAAMTKLDTAIEVYGMKFSWLTFAYKVNHNKFKLFDPAAVFSSQIVDTSFVSHEVRVQYSRYSWSKGAFESWFYCIGAAFGYGDNFLNLNKTEISETTNYGPNPGDRAVTKKYNAYKGNYTKDMKSLRLYGDYYRFLFSGNVAALHGYPELLIRSNEKPVWNLGFGFLLSFKDDKESVVNAELYYNFLDLFKVTETDYDLFERNDIGIRFSFPIKFKNK
jgi:hypothetical protein